MDIEIGELKGEDGVREALVVLVKVARELDMLKLRKEQEAEPFKTVLGEIESRFKELMEPWLEMDSQLRETVLREHEGTDPVKIDGVGELVFPLRWTFEVTDEAKVEKKYLSVDSSKVNAAIKGGVGKIRGIRVYQKRGLTVRKEKSE